MAIIMNTEEIKEGVLLKLNDHDNRISELSHRVSGQEEQIKIIGELSLSVRELAVNMKNMVREQISQGERITRLERAPITRYETLICAVLSAAAGALLGLFF